MMLMLVGVDHGGCYDKVRADPCRCRKEQLAGMARNETALKVSKGYRICKREYYVVVTSTPSF